MTIAKFYCPELRNVKVTKEIPLHRAQTATVQIDPIGTELQTFLHT